MFGNLFNRKSAQPEKRLAASPELLELPPDDDRWITSQVFQHPRRKKERVYHDTRLSRSSSPRRWDVRQIVYDIEDEFSLSAIPSRYLCEIDEVIRDMIVFERNAVAAGYKPIPGLEGNYRQVVARLGIGYFDGRGDYVPLRESGDRLVTREALLDRTALGAMYGTPGASAAEPPISTWDDFYREVVDQHPERDLRYLRSLLQRGVDCYQQFTAAVNPRSLERLSGAQDDIIHQARYVLKFSPERSKQIANLITQGPDPYAGPDGKGKRPAPKPAAGPHSP